MSTATERARAIKFHGHDGEAFLRGQTLAVDVFLQQGDEMRLRLARDVGLELEGADGDDPDDAAELPPELAQQLSAMRRSRRPVLTRGGTLPQERTPPPPRDPRLWAAAAALAAELRGSKGEDDMDERIPLIEGRVARDERALFGVRVFDPATGEPIPDIVPNAPGRELGYVEDLLGLELGGECIVERLVRSPEGHPQGVRVTRPAPGADQGAAVVEWKPLTTFVRIRRVA